MGIFDWLLSHGDDEQEPQEEVRTQPTSSKTGAGPDINAVRRPTKTEKDLRRVEAELGRRE